YTRFIEIVIKHHLPDSIGNELISWFNDYKMDPNVVLLTSMKQG
ncbi:11306_t:CDS:1, partial [Dentiscutata erythropus]